MTRLPKDWVATLALSAGLLLAGGCGDAPPKPLAEAMDAEASAVSVANEANSPDDVPQAFVVPERLLPLTTTPQDLPAKQAATKQPLAPVLAQYSQPAGTLPDLPAMQHIPQSQATQPIAAVMTAPASVYGPQLGPAAGPQQQTARSAAMQPVSDQAAVMSRRAYGMAQKGMLFAARQELVQALQLVAQARDAQGGAASHSAALSTGLTALKEAEDFSPTTSRSEPIEVASVARGHRTTILKGAREVPPVVAQQQYFGYAQQQLAMAVGNEPGASQALYTLGKIHSAMAGGGSEAQSLDGPRAMVFYQAALAVDSRNYLAANELGVLLARYGQLDEARRALLHSVSTRPHAEGWHNLAIVHRRLGEADLARLADNERQLLAKNPAAASRTSAEQLVEWVDPQTFAARGSHQQDWPAPTAAAAAKPPTTNQPRR